MFTHSKIFIENVYITFILCCEKIDYITKNFVLKKLHFMLNSNKNLYVTSVTGLYKPPRVPGLQNILENHFFIEISDRFSIFNVSFSIAHKQDRNHLYVVKRNKYFPSLSHPVSLTMRFYRNPVF